MKVSCPACQTTYNIDDKRIPSGGAKLKCARCQTTFPVKPGEAAAAVPLPGSAGSAVPLPGSAGGAVPLPGSQGFGAIPLPGTQGRAGAVPLPGVHGHGGASAVPLPGGVPPPPSAYGAVPLPGAGAPGAIPLPGAGWDAPSAPPRAEQTARFAQAGAVPLPGSGAAASLPEADDDWESASTRVMQAPSDAFGALGGHDGGGAVPLPGSDFPGTARDFDFQDAPAPAAAPAHDPFSFDVDMAAPEPQAPGGIDFDAPTAAMPTVPPPPGAFDFQDLPSPAGAHEAADPFALPPPPQAAPLDFQDLPSPAGDAYAHNPSTDFGDVDFGAPAEPAPASQAADLEMLSFGDEGAGAPAAAAAPQGGRLHVRRRSGKVFGPFDEATIVKMLEDGQLLGNEDVSADAQDWSPIGTVPAFSDAIQRLMEGPSQAGGGADAAAEPQRADPAHASMERMRNLYEGRMAAVAVVDRSRQTAALRARLPLLVAAGVVAVAVLAGLSVGLTRYGMFGHKKLWPARVAAGSSQAVDVALAQKELQRDTYRGYVKARALAEKVLEQKEYPEVRALWAQAVYYLQRRYAAASPAELQLAAEKLPDVELLGEDNLELLKARAGRSLSERSPDAPLAALEDAWGRDANAGDVELGHLLAEALAQKGRTRAALKVLERVLARQKASAKALHARGDLFQADGQAEEAAAAYAAALQADPLHVRSALELAAVELLVRRDVARGTEALVRAQDPKAQKEMGPAELARVRTLNGTRLLLEGKPRDAEAELLAALEKDPASVSARVELAQAVRAQGRLEDALPLLREVVEKTPGRPDYAEALVRAELDLGRIDDARRSVEAAMARAPDSARLALLAATAEDLRDADASAEDHYKRALAAQGDLLEARLGLVRLQLRQRRFTEAKAGLEEAQKTAGDSAALTAVRGDLALAGGDLAAAQAAFERAVALAPELAEAHLGLARVALLRSDLPTAQAEVDRALALAPHTLRGARLQRGLVLWKSGKLDEASVELDKVAAEHPRSVEVAVAQGAVRLARGDVAGAEGVLQGALALEPTHPEALYYLAQVRARRYEFGRAVDGMRDAVARAPRRADFQYALGLILRDAKRPGEAVEAWKAALTLDPQYADAHEALGQAYLDRGDFDGAVKAFEAALKADPARVRALGLVGDAFFAAARWDDAIKRYQSALKADPKLVQLFYKVGRAYTEQGRYAQAIDWYRRAVDAEPENPQAWYYLGFAYKERSQRPDAVRAFKAYLAKKPNAEDKKDILDEIYDLEH